jgi:hypothetical protein
MPGPVSKIYNVVFKQLCISTTFMRSDRSGSREMWNKVGSWVFQCLRYHDFGPLLLAWPGAALCHQFRGVRSKGNTEVPRLNEFKLQPTHSTSLFYLVHLLLYGKMPGFATCVLYSVVLLTFLGVCQLTSHPYFWNCLMEHTQKHRHCVIWMFRPLFQTFWGCLSLGG